MIVEDLKPLSVEDKGFKRLVNGHNPRYDLASRREIGRTLLPSIYNREVERVRQELEKVKRIALTTDIVDVPTNKSIHHSDSSLHIPREGPQVCCA